MNKLTCGLTGLSLLLTASGAWAQQPSGGESTNLAIPVVRVGPAAPVVPPVQITGFAEIIRARFPLSIAFSELGAGWRIIEYGGVNYFTKGDTAILNNEEYLVAYQGRTVPVSSSKLETRDYIRYVTTGQLGGFEPDDRFAITLMKMDHILRTAVNGQTGLRSFSPEAVAQEGSARKFDPPLGSSAYRQKLSLIYLGKIHEALAAYSRAYLNVMPPMESAFAARQALLPFAENDAIFFQPGTTTPYKANPLFSERKREHLRSKARTVVFYEAAPAADGMRAVLFYNGRVQRVDAEAWNRLSKASELE